MQGAPNKSEKLLSLFFDNGYYVALQSSHRDIWNMTASVSLFVKWDLTVYLIRSMKEHHKL